MPAGRKAGDFMNITAAVVLIKILFIAMCMVFLVCALMVIVGMISDTQRVKNKWKEAVNSEEYHKRRKRVKRMKKTGGVVCIIIIATMTVTALVFNMLMKTSFVEEKAEKVADVVRDETIKEKVNVYVQELLDSGYITEEQIQSYIQNVESDPALTLRRADGTVIGTAGTQNPEQGVQPEQPVPSAAAEIPASGGGQNTKSITSKVLAAMSPSDLAIAQNLMSKVDAGYVMSLMNSDMNAAKAYVKQTLSSAEIAQGIDLYGKYAYVLNE